jgi:hypothetical protein
MLSAEESLARGPRTTDPYVVRPLQQASSRRRWIQVTQLLTVAQIAFEIESVFTVSGRGVVVLARWLGPQSFASLGDATLGGVPIEPRTDIPRKLGLDGQPRIDLFAFLLRRPEDRTRFVPGERVLLEAATE